ncbi:MAG: hypothetical protein C5B45_00295 [Chlamydiae bacterium]|nr:MAG: hypothetical protein C5B45_00295 [Chlamydiota bacterium]
MSYSFLDLLAALGSGFDCASKREIDAVLKSGVNSSSIIYANPCKAGSFITYAASMGVDVMTFDNELELQKIKKLFPRARRVLRIRVDDSKSICQLGMKFGCYEQHVPHLLRVAKDLEINVFGVSFHVGSDCQDIHAYAMALETSAKIFALAKTLGFDFTFLAIGGGFPGFKEDIILFKEIANSINEKLDRHFPATSGIEIIAEPGRYFTASAFTLCTNIIAKRELSFPNEDTMSMYYVNDGLYGSFNCLIFDHAVVTPLAYQMKPSSEGKLQKSSVWGPTCDGMDCILKTCYLPSLNIGDWIIFENMGAYTISAASNFNGFEKPALKFILPLSLKNLFNFLWK